jgi:arsenate reductase (thioredoxin)
VITLRAATVGDAPAIASLLTTASLPVAGLEAALPHAVIAEEAGTVVGVAALEFHGADALLRSVAVAPAHRRAGLGLALTLDRLGAARTHGVQHVWLLTETAVPFFAQLGFATVARTSAPAALAASVEFAEACPASATAMRVATAGLPATAQVLVLCTGNSARSQIAEALLATRGAGRVLAASAGSAPAPRVNPFAIETLAARGIPWDGRRPKTIAEVEGPAYSLVITVCDNAREACPVLPGAAAMVHWGLPDPADHTEPTAARAAFAATFDALARRVSALLATPFERLAPEARSEHARRIHALAGELDGSRH